MTAAGENITGGRPASAIQGRSCVGHVPRATCPQASCSASSSARTTLLVPLALVTVFLPALRSTVS